MCYKLNRNQIKLGEIMRRIQPVCRGAHIDSSEMCYYAQCKVQSSLTYQGKVLWTISSSNGRYQCPCSVRLSVMLPAHTVCKSPYHIGSHRSMDLSYAVESGRIFLSTGSNVESIGTVTSPVGDSTTTSLLTNCS